MSSASDRGRAKTDKPLGARGGAVPQVADVEGEAFFETLFRDLPQNLVVLRLVKDKRGRPCDLVFVAISNALAEVIDLGNPVGRSVSKFDLHFRDRDPDVLELCARVSTSGVPETHQGYYPPSDKWFEIRVSPLPGDRVLAAVENVTERLRTQTELQRLQYSIDHMDDYPTWTDSQGRIIEVSESTCRHLGYTRDELLSMTVFDICPEVDAKGWPDMWKRLRPPATLRREVHHRTKSGRLYPVDLTINAMVFGGQEYHCTFCRDLSERRRLEESLRLTQSSVDNAPDPIYWLESNAKLVFGNQAFCDLLGYSLDELRSMHIWDIDPSLTLGSWPDAWARVRANGTFRHEEVFLGKDGREHSVEISSTHVQYGGREYGVTVARDITDRKRTEQRLQLMLYSLDHSDDYPLWTDSEGRIVEVSESTCRHLEYTRDELLNMTVFDINPALTPENWGKNLETKREFGSVFIEGPHRTKSGKVFPVEGSVSMFTFGGVEYGCAFCRDITGRKEAEESLLLTQLSVDSAADLVHWTDLDGRLVYANQSLASCLGYSREELLSLHIWNIVHGLSPELFFTRRDQARGGDSFRREGALMTKDGRTVPTEVFAKWVELNGRILVVSTNRDMTERTEMLHTLLERDEQLRQSQKMEAVGRLAGGIAHDFNNVLTTIIGYSDLLLSSPECPQGSIAEDIAEIKAAAERAGALTRRILTFSRRQAMQPAAMSLNTVVSETERLLDRTIDASIELRTSLDPDLGEVEIDEHQFVQVLLNLSVNARDAMPRGGTLTIATANVDLDKQFCQTHPEAHPGPYVVLTVTDNGTGMDSQVLAHVFEPFYTTKPPGQGTGLGLATVYGIVAQSGGCVYVQSEPGRGTTFTVYLPRLDAPAKSANPDLRSPESDPRGRTIMVVDSDAAFLALATRVLKRRGYRVLSHSDGEQALSALTDPSILVDALLTDLRLSGMLQGEQLAGMAVHRRPNLPVLFMSAEARDTMVEAGRIDQQATYMEKPFTADELARSVRTCLAEA
jgi:two-component system cell cycle sensor histidine kinase/response regulator CckA